LTRVRGRLRGNGPFNRCELCAGRLDLSSQSTCLFDDQPDPRSRRRHGSVGGVHERNPGVCRCRRRRRGTRNGRTRRAGERDATTDHCADNCGQRQPTVRAFQLRMTGAAVMCSASGESLVPSWELGEIFLIGPACPVLPLRVRVAAKFRARPSAVHEESRRWRVRNCAERRGWEPGGGAPLSELVARRPGPLEWVTPSRALCPCAGPSSPCPSCSSFLPSSSPRFRLVRLCIPNIGTRSFCDLVDVRGV
jgi:hypothetical protein